MNFLFHSPFIDHKPDTFVYTAGVFLFGIFFMMFLIIKSIRKPREKTPELSDSSVDNVVTLANAIENQIQRCESAKDLNSAIHAIGRYEWQFMDDLNAKREAKKLKLLLDKRAAQIYEVIEPGVLK